MVGSAQTSTKTNFKHLFISCIKLFTNENLEMTFSFLVPLQQFFAAHTYHERWRD